MPQPRLIDPAVFYDIVKIRRAVDEATDDSVRATTGISNTSMNSQMGRMDPFGSGNANGPKMSKERIFKIRQKAVRALAKAFSLDEVAASVATMQATSSLEDVAMHVSRRDKNDTDAKYVHFFHEKIPSCQLEHFTPLDPLTDIIGKLPWEMQPAPLRTRALIQIFKSEHEAAATDLTLGLHIAQDLRSRHKPGADQLVLAKQFKEDQEKWNKHGKDWRQVPQLKEEDQPSSLVQQMLFNRAGVYLSIACQNVHAALDGLKDYRQKADGTENAVLPEDAAGQNIRLEARKKVKTCAKRALKDYLAFLAHFDYTPGLSVAITDEIMRRVDDLANGSRPQHPPPRSKMIESGSGVDSDGESVNGHITAQDMPQQHNKTGIEWDSDGWPRLPKPEIHPVSALFAASPLPNLPPFPSRDSFFSPDHRSNSATRETVTYHPLLTDALHSVLLAHALLQTSSAEILRHAHNAARLARIADGYPIFQSARSPARADWIEVLRRANNWIGLSHSWQKLCQPAPLPGHVGRENSSASKAPHYPSSEIALRKDVEDGETEEQKRERRKQAAILDALSDERVTDQDSFHRAVRAREKRAIDDEQGLSGPLSDKAIENVPDQAGKNGHGERVTNGHTTGSAPQDTSATRWAQDDGMEYPISSDRAEAVARWIREAPLSMGVKKKRPAKKRTHVNGAAHDSQGSTVNGHKQEQDEEEVD